MIERVLTVGTRGSRLALEQTRRVREGLSGPSRLRVIRTSGDRFRDKPLHQQEGVGFFTKEIEQELTAGTIDLAVHSLKDLPTRLAPDLSLGAVLERDDSSDVLLVRPEVCDPGLPLPVKSGSKIGASSLRRQALLGIIRGDLVSVPIRGNVPTRIEKVKRGDCDAVVIARAGLARLRLNVEPLLAFDLNPRLWVCAPGQGAIAVEVRQQDAEARQRLAGLNHAVTTACVEAERALLVAFGGGCHAPFGALAQIEDRAGRLFVAAPGSDGAFRVEGFEKERLEEACRAAEGWIRAGCPALSGGERASWASRPARPWC